MTDCEYLKTKDVTPWHGDVFDHPEYIYICELTKEMLIPCIHCNKEKCKNYNPIKE